MFDRAALKNAAKARVSNNRWMAVCVALVASFFFSSSGGSGGFFSGFSSSFSEDYSSNPSLDSAVNTDIFWTILIVVMVVAAFFLLIGWAFKLCVSNIVIVGFYSWFLRYSRGENPDFGDMFSGFSRFKSSFVTMFLHDLYLFLWSLLLIVPGIIKGYAYILTPYILNDNPNLSAKQVIKISEIMMDGWKWEYFVFELSFIGWELLSMLTFGLLGIFYVAPYMYTSRAMLYDNIKMNAIYERGVIDPAVLNMPAYPMQEQSETTVE